jgi:HK97 gp10 family phage protein
MSVRINQGAVRTLFRDPRGPCGEYMNRVGLRVETRAKRLCPVDKGRLRASITSTNPFLRGVFLVVRIGSNVRYARYVNNGTRFMRGRRFLNRALE